MGETHLNKSDHMRGIRIIIILAIFTLASQATVTAQADKNGILVRALFNDYKGPNGGTWFDFQDYNVGFDIGYVRKLNDRIWLNIPFKVSSINFEDSLTNTNVYSLDAQIHYRLFKDERKVNPYVGAGIGIQTDAFDEFYAAIPGVAGANIKVGGYSYINMEASYRYALEDDRNAFALGLGLIHFLGKEEKVEVKEISDMDGDGIPDEVDLCPERPGLDKFFGCPDTDGDGLMDDDDQCPLQPGPIELEGCPDSDGDGVSDIDDQCPNEPGTVENLGCPVLDRDGDGVPDNEDICPEIPGPAILNGCPDQDGDGIADRDDRCPDQPGPRLLQGCPDRDGDGIADIDDRCPDLPGIAENKGCPELEEEEKRILEFAVQNVEFEFGKATLANTSFSILDQISDIMKRYPGYKLRITGHTDNVGSESNNQALSERRARSCYEYMVSKGISSSRLSYLGRGESDPIESNDTAEGRSRNRRVEFDLYID
jgi:outer membrane protein OmpA-like peptidoglycan-associated protein